MRDNSSARAVPHRQVTVQFLLAYVSARAMRREVSRCFVSCNGELFNFAFRCSVFVARYNTLRWFSMWRRLQCSRSSFSFMSSAVTTSSSRTLATAGSSVAMPPRVAVRDGGLRLGVSSLRCRRKRRGLCGGGRAPDQTLLGLLSWSPLRDCGRL